jgi:prepilin-type processing-associated H-X9-DG protein
MYADDSSDAFPITIRNVGPDIWVSYTQLMKRYAGMSGRAKVFACPSDTFYYEDVRIPQSQHQQSKYYYSSYAFNGGNSANKAFVPPPSPPWPGIAGRKLSSIKEPIKTVLVAEFPALNPYSWHQPVRAARHYNNAQCMVSFVDGHASFIKMYWNAEWVDPFHSNAFHYEPPTGYDYKWTGD